MAKSRESYSKKEVRNKKEKKRKDKEKKRIERKDNPGANAFDDMIAYVDEFGNISSTPPDPFKKKQEIDPKSIEVSVSRQEFDERDSERKGTVTFYNDAKGYGFIKDMGNGQSIFMHANNVLEPVKEGNIVSYKTEKGQKGLMAIYVKIFREQPPKIAKVENQTPETEATAPEVPEQEV
jgi:cold shock CspA family protein